MRYPTLLLAVLSTVCLHSCKKDKDPVPKPAPPVTPPAAAPDYTHLKEGNYWIYQLYEIDSTGYGNPLPLFDSVYAGPDTLFKGQKHHTRMVPTGDEPGTYRMECYRDSLGYIMSGNEVYSSSKDFTSVLYQAYSLMYEDTVALVQVRMTDENAMTTVPAGSFATITRSQQWHMFPKFRSGGTLRKRNTCFSATAGIIAETLPFYTASPTMQQRRLVRYHVAD